MPTLPAGGLLHGHSVGLGGNPERSLRTSRSEGWNVVTGTLFRSSSRSTTWLRIIVRSWSTELPSSSAASASEYGDFPVLDNCICSTVPLCVLSVIVGGPRNAPNR